MSEYQYYEFWAIDRPLTTDEMAALRGLSTSFKTREVKIDNVRHLVGDRSESVFGMKGAQRGNSRWMWS